MADKARTLLKGCGFGCTVQGGGSMQKNSITAGSRGISELLWGLRVSQREAVTRREGKRKWEGIYVEETKGITNGGRRRGQKNTWIQDIEKLEVDSKTTVVWKKGLKGSRGRQVTGINPRTSFSFLRSSLHRFKAGNLLGTLRPRWSSTETVQKPSKYLKFELLLRFDQPSIFPRDRSRRAGRGRGSSKRNFFIRTGS